MREHSLGIVVPAFNEESGIRRCVEEIMRVVSKLKIKAKLIIVNDGSKDQTLAILLQCKAKYRNLVVVNAKLNKGYGHALASGVAAAKRLKLEYVLFMDSDLTNSPSDIPKFVAKMGEAVDCVKASRYIFGGGMVGVPPQRVLLSVIANMGVAPFFNLGILDCTNGFRMVRRSLIDNIHFHENGFAIIMEELMVLKKKRARFTEIPVILTSREKGASSFQYSWQTIFDYAKYAFFAPFV